MNVLGISSGLAVAPALPRPGGSGFTMPAAASAPSAAAVATVRTESLDALLALQEQTTGSDQATARDRQSRRRGQGLLTALAALQHALLQGCDATAALQDMAALLTGPPADAPQLEAVLRSLSLRAGIELARRGW